MKKWFLNLNNVVQAGLMGALSIPILLVVILVGKLDNQPGFNEAYLTVYASFSQVFEQEFNPLWAVLGIVISIAFPAIYNLVFKGVSAGTGEYSAGHTYFIGWALAAALIILTFTGGYGNSEYSQIVDESTFHYLRSHPEEVYKLFVK